MSTRGSSFARDLRLSRADTERTIRELVYGILGSAAATLLRELEDIPTHLATIWSANRP